MVLIWDMPTAPEQKKKQNKASNDCIYLYRYIDINIYMCVYVAAVVVVVIAVVIE